MYVANAESNEPQILSNQYLRLVWQGGALQDIAFDATASSNFRQPLGNIQRIYPGREPALQKRIAPRRNNQAPLVIDITIPANDDQTTQSATLVARLERNRLHLQLTAKANIFQGFTIQMPWLTTGYFHDLSFSDLDRNNQILGQAGQSVMPFRWLSTDRGQLIPIEHFKRLQKSTPWYFFRRTHGAIPSTNRVTLVPDPHKKNQPQISLMNFEHPGFFEFAEQQLNWRVWAKSDDPLASAGSHTANLTLQFDAAVNDLPFSGLPTFSSGKSPWPDAAESPAQLMQKLYWHTIAFYGGRTGIEWREALALSLAWSPLTARAEQMTELLSWPLDGEGCAYTLPDSPGWAWPYRDLDQDGQNDYDLRHAGACAGLINAAWQYAGWTRDAAFINRLMPNLRRAMDFQLNNLGGITGLIRPANTEMNGLPSAISCNYYDVLPFGNLSAPDNLWFIESLHSMAELEIMSGDQIRADELLALRKIAVLRFRDVFWIENKGRFAACVDSEGKTHDFGFVDLNLQAITRNVASEQQQKQILQWLDQAAESVLSSQNVNRWRFAPRFNTIPVSDWFSQGWVNQTGPEIWGYGTQIQNGGAMLSSAYYATLARIVAGDVSGGWRSYGRLLSRFALPDRLTGAAPMSKGENPQGGGNPAAVAVAWQEFPESALVGSIPLYAFLGAEIRSDGLILRPNVPPQLGQLEIQQVEYAGCLFDIYADSNGTLRLRTRDAQQVSYYQLNGLPFSEVSESVFEVLLPDKTEFALLKRVD